MKIDHFGPYFALVDVDRVMSDRYCSVVVVESFEVVENVGEEG